MPKLRDTLRVRLGGKIMEYVITAIVCLAVGAVTMGLVAGKIKDDELNDAYDQGYKAGCSRTWAQVRKYTRKSE